MIREGRNPTVICVFSRAKCIYLMHPAKYKENVRALLVKCKQNIRLTPHISLLIMVWSIFKILVIEVN